MGLWHAYRRKWAMERKHLPLRDVAAAGGWKDVNMLLEVYQQADEASVLAVMTETRKLRERGVAWKLDQNSTAARQAKSTAAQRACGASLYESGRRDLNPRPPEPHSGALPDCATSRPPPDTSQTDRRTSLVASTPSYNRHAPNTLAGHGLCFIPSMPPA